MLDHPCSNGLSPSCFAAFPDWVKQALSYKLLQVLLPKKIMPALKAGLEIPLIGSGSTLPGGVELPQGSIIPPELSVPENWIPWFYFIFSTPEDPRTLFPIDWNPGDPLPFGVKLPEGYILPAGWIPTDPPHPFYLPGYIPFPIFPDIGAVPPLFVKGWEPGPIRGPGGVITTTLKEQTRRPISDISVQCTPYGGGSNYVEVYEEIADGDLTYNTAFAGMGNTDIFGITAFTLPAGAVNIKVYVYQSAKATDFIATCPQVVSSLRIGGVDYVHPFNADLSLDYPTVPFEFFYSTNPSGGAWTPAGVNAIEGIGYFSYIHEPITDVRHTQIYIFVEWD